MAVTTTIYGLAQKHFANADLDWDTHSFKVSLHTSSYTPAQDTHETYSDLTNELAASGNYSTGGASLAGMTSTYDTATNNQKLTATNLTFSALTPSGAFRYAVVRKSTGSAATEFLVCYINFGADQNPGGSDFTLSWAATGVLYMNTA
jgi:hypothetical protein